MQNISEKKYEAQYAPNWHARFDKLDNSMKIRAVKKISRILGGLPAAHAQLGLPYFKENIDSNYRICYCLLKEKNVLRFYFVGDHKEYGKWLAGGGGRE